MNGMTQDLAMRNRLGDMEIAIDEAILQIAERDASIEELRCKLELVALSVTETLAFIDWLLEQDNSSTMADYKGAGNGRQHGVKGKTNVELVLEFIASGRTR